MRAAEPVPLGLTGLRVSRLGLGLASLSGLFAPVTDRDATAVLDRAWRSGIRLCDPGPVRVLAGRQGRRPAAGAHALALARLIPDGRPGPVLAFPTMNR
jgi:D-threo-aldose 1-dehydrogenase